MAQNICKNCGNNFTGKYCNNCGEKLYSEKDKNVTHLLEEAFHFITHFEGTFFNTFKSIITTPGKLSLDYCNGIRKKYFKPLSFFLLLVVIYLLFPVFEGLNQRLYYHTHNYLYGKYALHKCLHVMQTQHLSDKEITELFHQKSEKTSKFLLFIIIPIMAFFSWLIGLKKRKLFFDHFIFSIEEISFLILWGFLILPVILFLSKLVGLNFIFSDIVIDIVILIFFLTHLILAVKRFFHFKWINAILFSFTYCFLLGCVSQFLYKFILFVITINQIST